MDAIQNPLIDTATTLSTHYLPLTPIAVLIGVTCLVAQIFLTLLLDKRIFPRKWQGPWNDLPGFTAHQLIAFPSMCILTYYGMRDWFYNPDKEVGNETSYDRVFGETNLSDIPLAIGSGAILIWDTPTSLLVPALQDPLMLFHHVGMFLVAATMSGAFSGGKMIGYYYACYYFGVIEISSIPLTYVDVFHPKYKYYFEWLNHKKNVNRPVMKVIQGVNELCRIVFAILFLIFRGVYFPYVTFKGTIPDLWHAYNDETKQLPDGVPMWTGYFLICFVSLFALLQCYWGMLILKQIYKMVVPGDSGKKKKKKKSN
ncbi:hypothetical protein QTG54_006878 [Skeletonema marinoi]|uniref:TLC domain-containing protein n=1 Tax=Skeletonema marinoi TaxID=267567 RepID=A0AAD8Y9V4_9STRA|nr:hypothetical protein QTG54_006878 [Skeletonema marinoi]|mmetsp:Transcript_9454/g.14615  ORF Transcript_9454/g.14615 Transcript_9454/m.14615 type:complete len:313 (-) Transcript_9454:85-1023(-)|eukprot:CAMPEP_0113423396 /NCGR_PEP_ID=MMETSP0013_2-20120614/28995_1 /TAXON_ID=2843 ORGANISM="Skeletonema costatum, Strain 1716" /NCGR_SAMPLE_ID=MMETSP0013_2 /ASSEMBLY_ACC=CAM_ASM_000158 /LENGTH=312 /DNA_ID=CAMNT_0000311251 /DNA_START=73 /DNA_END=1011 /DNA_ORIENTATION=- /assembly_acc=CAM_ASM_000158